MRSLTALCLSTAIACVSFPAFADRDRGDDRDQGHQSRIKRGLALSPVPLDFKHNGRAKVGLGSYLVNAVGACNDCHTNPPFAPGGDPFKGEPKMINAQNYLAGGTVFGPFRSRNLTPDANGLPAGLALAQFKDVMRKGTDFDQLHPQISPLLQVMPWPVYREMTDRDLEAIYAFLSAIPHAEPAP
jgi:hypothetical protein